MTWRERGPSLGAAAGVLVACLCACGSSSSTSDGSSRGGRAASAGVGGGTAGTGVAGTAGGSSGRGGSPAGQGGGVSSGGGGAGGKLEAGRGGGAGVAGQTATPEAACRASIQAQCETKVRCGFYSDVALCTPFADLCPDLYFSEGSTRTVESILACLDALRGESCEEARAGVVPACLTPGTLADGAPCQYSSQCTSGVCDSSDGSTCTSCQHEPGPNEACDDVCTGGYFCHPTTKLCVPVSSASAAKEGEACGVTGTPFVGCAPGLGCWPAPAGAMPACHPLLGDGESCIPAGCAAPLVCAAVTPTESACLDPYGCSPPCPQGSHCLGPDGSPSCVPDAEQGEACGAALPSCASGLVCEGGTCAAEPRLGDACETSSDCAVSFRCTNGVCSWPEACP